MLSNERFESLVFILPAHRLHCCWLVYFQNITIRQFQFRYGNNTPILFDLDPVKLYRSSIVDEARPFLKRKKKLAIFSASSVMGRKCKYYVRSGVNYGVIFKPVLGAF